MFTYTQNSGPGVCGVCFRIIPDFTCVSSIFPPGPGPDDAPSQVFLPRYLPLRSCFHRPLGDSLLNCNAGCMSALQDEFLEGRVPTWSSPRPQGLAQDQAQEKWLIRSVYRI